MAARHPSLAAGHVGELVAELAPLLAGARVKDVHALPPRDLLLVLEGAEGGHVRRLRVSADPVAARVHLQVGRVRAHAGPPGPFYRALAERLEGARLVRIEQLGGDRVVRLDFARDGPGAPAALVCELFGRRANLLLLDGRGRIEAVLVIPKAGSAASSRLERGAGYEPPGGAPPARRPPPLAESLPPPPAPPAGPARELVSLAPLSWRVESSLGAGAAREHAERELGELRRRLERARSGAADLVRGLEERGRVASGAERLRMDAELLTAHFDRLKRGLREIEVEDAFEPDGPPRRIPLDPGLSPRKNVERLFGRYKKLLRSAERLPAELALARARLEHLEDLCERAGEADAPLAELEDEALRAELLRPRQAPPERRRVEPRRPYLAFRSPRGTEIRVGRSARDNDELTFKHARGNDLWLHTADAPGSHVVLRTEPGQEPDPEDVLDAAHLAIHFSPLRGTRRADVHVARCKEVRKPRRAPPGLVTLSGGRIRSIRVEPERLERLLDTRSGRAS